MPGAFYGLASGGGTRDGVRSSRGARAGGEPGGGCGRGPGDGDGGRGGDAGGVPWTTSAEGSQGTRDGRGAMGAMGPKGAKAGSWSGGGSAASSGPRHVGFRTGVRTGRCDGRSLRQGNRPVKEAYCRGKGEGAGRGRRRDRLGPGLRALRKRKAQRATRPAPPRNAHRAVLASRAAPAACVRRTPHIPCPVRPWRHRALAGDGFQMADDRFHQLSAHVPHSRTPPRAPRPDR
jgi:hypothetical protein